MIHLNDLLNPNGLESRLPRFIEKLIERLNAWT